MTGDRVLNVKKKKIVMVAACPFPANHGSPASIREMSEALVSLGHDVHIVTYPISENIPVTGPTIHRVPRVPFSNNNAIKVGPALDKFFFNPLMVFKLIYVIHRYKIDVIHAHNYEGVLIGWLAKLFTRKPLLYNAVNSMADELPTYDFFKNKNVARKIAWVLDKTLPFRGDHVTTVSDDLKHFLIDLGINKEKITVLPAGVFPEMFDQPNPSEVYERHGLDPDGHYMMYAGSLDAFQRIDYLIDTAYRVIQVEPSAKLLLVCNIENPEAKKKYQDYAASLGIQDNVLFFDHVPLEHLSSYLAMASVTVIPRPECPGHPVKVLNYMSARKAIAGFVGGAKGLTHEENALVVPNHDLDALAEQVVVLLRDVELRQRLGNNARDVVDQFYTWGRLTQGMDVIYDHLLGNVDSVEFRDNLSEFVLDNYSGY